MKKLHIRTQAHIYTHHAHTHMQTYTNHHTAYAHIGKERIERDNIFRQMIFKYSSIIQVLTKYNKL